MNLLIQRDKSSAKSTLGDLYVDEIWQCYTLEDVVREKVGEPVLSWKMPGQTAIPAGDYRVVIDFSSRFQRMMPHLLNVPGFEGVRIHSGNVAADTEGCILVGGIAREDAVLNSRLAFDALFRMMEAAAGDISISVRSVFEPGG